MPKKAKITGLTPERENIFPATQLTPMAIKWKELSAAGRHKEAMLLLEQIVIGSSAMFERLAQYDNFHFTVGLPILVSAAQEKVVKWLLRWQPRKGRLFSWFSKCAKNAFRSELVKVNLERRRYYFTSDNLERMYGTEDHDVDKHDVANEVKQSLNDMVCRWGDPQEIGAIRYLCDCIVDDDEHDKQRAIRAAAYAYGISFELSKFFYAWALTALRNQMFYRIHVPFTEQDLFRAAESYTHLPTWLDIVSWEQMKRIIAVFGGMRIKFPTMAYLAKLREDYALHMDVMRSDLDPESIAEVAQKHKKTQKSAQEIFDQMAEKLDHRRYGEYSIYEHAESE